MITVHLIPLAQFADLAILIVRLIAGTVMIYYGWPKVKNLKSNAVDFMAMGFKPGWLWGTIVAIVEFVGGLAVILGIYVWLFAGLFGFEMILGALWKITKTKKPFTDWSYDLLLLAVMIMLLITGAGDFSLF